MHASAADRKLDAIGIGRCCVDVVLSIPNRLTPNTTAPIVRKSIQGGGKAATAAVAMQKLGMQTGFVGVVGSDGIGSFCESDFRRIGVDVSHLLIDRRQSTGVSFVVSDQEERSRTILHLPASSRNLAIDDLDDEYLASARLLLLESQSCPVDVSIRAARIARRNGIATLFDGDAYEPSQADLIPLIDVFIGSEHFYEARFSGGSYEANCRALQKEGPRTVLFTLGSKGCIGCDGPDIFRIPAFDVPVADTLGAGDVFHGAYAFRMLQGASAAESARFASAASAIKCTRIGGRAGIPSCSVVDGFLETGAIDGSDLDREVAHYDQQSLCI